MIEQACGALGVVIEEGDGGRRRICLLLQVSDPCHSDHDTVLNGAKRLGDQRGEAKRLTFGVLRFNWRSSVAATRCGCSGCCSCQRSHAYRPADRTGRSTVVRRSYQRWLIFFGLRAAAWVHARIFANCVCHSGLWLLAVVQETLRRPAAQARAGPAALQRVCLFAAVRPEPEQHVTSPTPDTCSETGTSVRSGDCMG